MKKALQKIVCFITLSGAIAPARINSAEIENLSLQDFLILYNYDNLPCIGEILDYLNAEYKGKQARLSRIKKFISVLAPVGLLTYIFYPPKFDVLYHPEKSLAKMISIIAPISIIIHMFDTRKREADDAKHSLEYVSKGLLIAIQEFQHELERDDNPITSFTVILETCAKLKGKQRSNMTKTQLENRLITLAKGKYYESPNRYQRTPLKMEIWKHAYQAIEALHDKNDEALTQAAQEIFTPPPA